MQITERHNQPFSYLLAEACLTPSAERALLDWFETGAPWKQVSQDFYDQYEFSLLDVDLPGAAAGMVDPSELGLLRRELSEQFATSLSPQVNIVAHKLVTGQRIEIHNDHLPSGETHRLTVQLNRGLVDEDGGLIMLFNSNDAADVHRILRPVSGTALGFEISPASHHAVSRMHAGERFTIVYSFYAAKRG